jgi:hypothetical protein
MFEQKRFAGRHLLTFESQKLNYFGNHQWSLMSLIRERPFNLKEGVMVFILKKNILIPNVAEKNILILVEEKKNNLIQSFCHIT